MRFVCTCVGSYVVRVVVFLVLLVVWSVVCVCVGAVLYVVVRVYSCVVCVRV